jgi:hypothetical protein
MPHFGAWYTPAYFSGRVLLNRRLGTVQQFRLRLATGKALNVHLTVEAAGDNRQAHDVVRVERMELTGGEALADISWTKSLATAEAERRLAKVFFKFLETDWVPFDQVLGQARRQARPILAIVSPSDHRSVLTSRMVAAPALRCDRARPTRPDPLAR